MPLSHTAPQVAKAAVLPRHTYSSRRPGWPPQRSWPAGSLCPSLVLLSHALKQFYFISCTLFSHVFYPTTSKSLVWWLVSIFYKGDSGGIRYTEIVAYYKCVTAQLIAQRPCLSLFPILHPTCMVSLKDCDECVWVFTSHNRRECHDYTNSTAWSRFEQ